METTNCLYFTIYLFTSELMVGLITTHSLMTSVVDVCKKLTPTIKHDLNLHIPIGVRDSSKSRNRIFVVNHPMPTIHSETEYNEPRI